jgi:hypothetical protein
MYIFNPKGDYVKELEEYTQRLIDARIGDREKRIEKIEELIDAYVEQVELRPPSNLLSRLTQYILMEEIKDTDPYKVRKEEHPFLSEAQIKRRLLKESSDSFAEHFIGSDGKKYNIPLRRGRSMYEILYVEGVFKKLKPTDKLPRKDEE